MTPHPGPGAEAALPPCGRSLHRSHLAAQGPPGSRLGPPGVVAGFRSADAPTILTTFRVRNPTLRSRPRPTPGRAARDGPTGGWEPGALQACSSPAPHRTDRRSSTASLKQDPPASDSAPSFSSVRAAVPRLSDRLSGHWPIHTLPQTSPTAAPDSARPGPQPRPPGAVVAVQASARAHSGEVWFWFSSVSV